MQSLRFRSSAPRSFTAFALVCAATIAAGPAAAAPADLAPPAPPQGTLHPGRPPVASADGVVGVIVELEEPLARYQGGVAGLAATAPTAIGRRRLDPVSASSRAYLAYLDARFDDFERTARQRLTRADVVYRLPVAVGGLAMRVERGELDALKALPGVRRVYPDEAHHLDTSRTPTFLGAKTLWKKVGGKAKAGKGIVVGILDSGIWPEHPSFADPDPAGRAYPVPPVVLTGDFCQFATGANTGAPFTCNNKLIGARRFQASYEAQVGLLPGELSSARDQSGHGTHTASTVAGNNGVAAQILGRPLGNVSGIAPRAHVIAYKVCGVAGKFRPGWTPGQIKSALMTTAITSVVKEDGVTVATPFDDGSGRIDLARAFKPGITFDVPASVYEAGGDALWNANYPSLFLPAMPGRMTVFRTAHDVTGLASQWQIAVTSPPDVVVTVPALLDVPAGGDAVLPITVDARSVPLGETRHARLTLTKVGDVAGLTFPITLVRGQPALQISNGCTPATIPIGGTTSCTVTVENRSFAPAAFSLSDRIPGAVKIKTDTVAGAAVSGRTIVLDGALYARQGPQIAVVPATGADAPAFGHLDTTGGGCTPLGGAADETYFYWTNVPSFAWAGEAWTGMMMVSNGYLVVNGTSGSDFATANQPLPDERRPNNVLAPFWTDLFPGPLGAGEMRYCWYSIGATTWGIWDWHGVRNRANNRLNSFQPACASAPSRTSPSRTAARSRRAATACSPWERRTSTATGARAATSSCRAAPRSARCRRRAPCCASRRRPSRPPANRRPSRSNCAARPRGRGRAASR